LAAEEIDDTAAFINDNNDEMNADDVAMQEIDDDENDQNKMNLSTNIENIPQRDYEAMMKEPEQGTIDPAMEQQALIEEMMKQMQNEDENKNKVSYRSATAVVPQRNYDNLMAKKDDNDDISMKEKLAEEERQRQERVAMATTSTGYWVCPSSTCDHLNKSTRNNCSVCHTLKPTYKRTAELMDDSIDQLGLENRWVCRNCDGLNKGSRQKCVYCKHTKQYQPASKSAAKNIIQSSKNINKSKKSKDGIFKDIERWVCPNKECNFLNKGSRLQCQVCHTERKDTQILWGDRAKKDDNDNSNNKKKVEENTKDEDKNKKKTYSHPLEARMMGMEVDQLHNVSTTGNNNNADATTTTASTDNVDWPCPICTFLNKGSKCEMCGCPKDAQ